MRAFAVATCHVQQCVLLQLQLVMPNALLCTTKRSKCMSNCYSSLPTQVATTCVDADKVSGESRLQTFQCARGS